MRLTLGLELTQIGGSINTPFGKPLIDYLSSSGTFVFSTNPSGNMVLKNQGKSGEVDDAECFSGRALQLGTTNELAIPTFTGGYITYHNIGTKTVVQEPTDGTDKSFLNMTVNNIVVHQAAFDTAPYQSNPNLLAQLALGNPAMRYYACSEPGNALVYEANSLEAGSFYFNSSKTTDQTYTMRMPTGTSVILNGTVYNGNGTTNVTATTTDKFLKFTESVDGVLNYFNCNTNQLTGSIPDLSNNTNLQYFYCHANQLTGNIPSLSNNTALKQFYCYSNQLTGSIPDLSSNTNLQSFYCHANKLTGSIPDLSSNTNLQSFYCHANKLTGSIPDLSNNTNLQYFYCHANQLTGNIPSLSNNTNLKSFYCHANKLTGSIPDLSSNTNLQSFYCHANKLTTFVGGTIKVTSQFSASNNQLTIAAVDNILQGLVDGNTTGSVTIALSGGTNGVPTNTAAIDTLRGRGCTVTVSGGY